MLPHTGAAGAFAFAERLRRSVSARSVVVADGVEIAVTVSVGVASGTGDVSELLRRVDMALYAAKAGGRDRVAADRPASAAA